MSTEPLPDPVVEPTISAMVQPLTEPAAELAAEPAAKLAVEPTSDPIIETPMATVPVAPNPVVPAPARTIGRYSHADLLKMVGKRGRKPPEFYQVYPRDESTASATKPSANAGSKKARAPRAKALPAVSSAVIGEHTIDELLAMIGTTGRKPVAFDILQQSAQVFADAKAIDLPSAPVDPLITAFAAAPKGVREAITALLAATKKK